MSAFYRDVCRECQSGARRAHNRRIPGDRTCSTSADADPLHMARLVVHTQSGRLGQIAAPTIVAWLPGFLRFSTRPAAYSQCNAMSSLTVRQNSFPGSSRPAMTHVLTEQLGPPDYILPFAIVHSGQQFAANPFTFPLAGC